VIKILLIVLISAYLLGAVIPLAFFKNNRMNIALAHLFALTGSLAGGTASICVDVDYVCRTCWVNNINYVILTYCTSLFHRLYSGWVR
jgi:hypothetical protein